MFDDHWSSCGLHSGPAYWPTKCDCGGFKAGKQPGETPDREDYTPAWRWRTHRQLWIARWHWLRENYANPALGRLSAIRSALGRRLCRSRDSAAQRHASHSCKQTK